MDSRSKRLTDSLTDRILRFLEKDSLAYTYLKKLWLEGNNSFLMEIDLGSLYCQNLDFEQRMTEADHKLLGGMNIKP